MSKNIKKKLKLLEHEVMELYEANQKKKVIINKGENILKSDA